MVTQWTLGHRSDFQPFCPTGREASGRTEGGTEPSWSPPAWTATLSNYSKLADSSLDCPETSDLHTLEGSSTVSLAPSTSLPCDWHADWYKVLYHRQYSPSVYTSGTFFLILHTIDLRPSCVLSPPCSPLLLLGRKSQGTCTIPHVGLCFGKTALK